MASTWQTRRYTVACPSCRREREVSRVQYWRLNKGYRKECKSCAESGNTKRLGTKQPASFKKMKRLEMIGNQRAKGFHAYSQEERQRRSEVMKGNKYNPGKRGSEHHSWKGGLGTERHLAQGRIEYKQWRNAVFNRDNYTCQLCDQYGGYLHADHIKKWADYPELRYDVNNGRTLCRVCHYYITFKHKMKTTSQWGLTSQEK